VKKLLWTTAVAGVLVITVSACGSKPKNSGTPTSAGGASTSSSPSSSASPSASGSAKPSGGTSSFKACLVTDTGGIDDRSFNASAYQGVKDSGVPNKFLQSQQASDYAPNIQTFITQKCSIIVTVGFNLGDATAKAAKANPDQKFAIVDFTYDPPLKNVKGLIYNTAQAGFLGGYLAAGMTKSQKVATFGGLKISTVTIYMDGFYDGVQYYNSKHGKNVQVLGWNEHNQKSGSFANSFTDTGKGKSLTQQFIQQGADIIFPVAGNVGLGAAAAVKASNGAANMLWVDTDGCISAPQFCKYFISSVVKGIPESVKAAIVAAKNGTFTGSNYVGTLTNGGAGLSPFHDFDSKVPAALKAELKTVQTGIENGSIKVASPSAPK